MGDLFTVLPFVFIAFGVLQLGRGGLAMYREKTFTDASVRADGEVTDVRRVVRKRTSGNNEVRRVTYYRAVLRFPLPDGRQVDAESYEETRSEPTVGSHVAVRYAPDDPTRCRMDDGAAGRWGAHGSTLFGGAVGIVFGLVFLGVGF